VNGIGFGTHLLIFGALVVNLWFGGDLVEAATTHQLRGLFELTLILGYLWFVIGIQVPLPGSKRWRERRRLLRELDEERQAEERERR
jgi:type VI protein secretion system component VasK